MRSASLVRLDLGARCLCQDVYKQVVKLTGISKSYIYQLVSQGLFPKSIKLIQGGSSVAWVLDEVNSWVGSRIQERDNEVA